MATVIFEMFLAETNVHCRVSCDAVWSARYLLCVGNFCLHHQGGWRRQRLHLKRRYTSNYSPSQLTRLYSVKSVLDAVHCFAVEGSELACDLLVYGGVVSAHVRDKVAGLQYLRGASSLPPLPLELQRQLQLEVSG